MQGETMIRAAGPCRDTTNDVEINVLGPLVIVRRGHVVPVPAGSRALVELLALEPGRARSDADLIDLLWPRHIPADPVRALRRRAMPVMRALGDALERTGGRWRITAERVGFDRVRFERLVADAEADLSVHWHISASGKLGDALAMWRGVPYPEIAHWAGAEPEIERLHERRLDALEHQVGLRRMRAGDDPVLAADLRALVLRFPHRERMWRELAYALHMTGQRTAAIRALDECRTAQRLSGATPSRQLGVLQSMLYGDHLDPSMLEASA